jgi:hypothetical protein
MADLLLLAAAERDFHLVKRRSSDITVSGEDRPLESTLVEIDNLLLSKYLKEAA